MELSINDPFSLLFMYSLPFLENMTQRDLFIVKLPTLFRMHEGKFFPSPKIHLNVITLEKWIFFTGGKSSFKNLNLHSSISKNL